MEEEIFEIGKPVFVWNHPDKKFIRIYAGVCEHTGKYLAFPDGCTDTNKEENTFTFSYCKNVC